MANGKWQSVLQIRQDLNGKDFDRITWAFALSRFAGSARLPEGYLAADKWGKVVVLSEAGKQYIGQIPDLEKTYRPADVNFAVFCLLFHHELLIDIDRSDIRAVHEILVEESLAARIRWPFIYGRQLYDKFVDTVSTDRIEHLAPNEVFPFLAGSPQGVFQVSTLVSGPLGFLTARQRRFHPPRPGAELWHCSDPGCRSAHFVSLLQPDVPAIKLRKRLRESGDVNLGPVSEWLKFLGDLAEGPVGSQLRTYYDVIAIIADCVLAEERTSLFGRALRGDAGPGLRETILKCRGEQVGNATQDLAASFSPEQQLQLLMTLTDSQLVKLIDQSVFQQTLTIPANEERNPHISPPKRYFTEAQTSLSSLGLREIVSEPIASLCAMIHDAYTATGSAAELNWRIRNMTGAPTQEALIRYLRATSPEVSVRELILSSGPITSIVVDELQYSGSLQSPELVPQLLWKIGFEVPRFNETYSRLRARLQTFNETVLAIDGIRSEDDRERIRSAGVNLFVSIEQVIEELISYNIWLLHADHFLATLFTFELQEAKQLVSSVLGAQLVSDRTTFTWNPASENTLGTLYRYLNETCSWIKSLLSREKESVRRPREDLPHYTEAHEKVFPFYHTQLWADVLPSALGAYVDDFNALARKLSQSNASAIRNGLDHQRPPEDFPSIDSMLAFAAKFKEALDHADIQRYVPKEFWFVRRSTDQSDRTEYLFSDYSNRSAALFEPSFAIGLRRLEPERPMLIAPGNLLGHLGATLTFQIRDKSNYAAYWKGYPRRRMIPPRALANHPLTTSSAAPVAA